MKSISIAVIGGGITGTATALQLIQKYPKHQITLISQAFSPQTTGDGAAGHWEPFCMGVTPEADLKYAIFSNLRCLNNITGSTTIILLLWCKLKTR